MLKLLNYFKLLFIYLATTSTFSAPKSAVNKDFEDLVTTQENMPPFLKLDPFSNKYVIHLSKFDFDSIIAKHRLNDKKYIKSLTWDQFNKSTTELMVSFYSKLSKFYKSELSSKFRRNFCAVLLSKLPLMEKRYFILRKKSSKGRIPEFTSHVKSLSSFAVTIIFVLFKFYLTICFV